MLQPVDPPPPVPALGDPPPPGGRVRATSRRAGYAGCLYVSAGRTRSSARTRSRVLKLAVGAGLDFPGHTSAARVRAAVRCDSTAGTASSAGVNTSSGFTRLTVRGPRTAARTGTAGTEVARGFRTKH